MELQRGDRVGAYEVQRLLGEGAMARVYRVRHDSGSLHALKLLQTGDPGVRARLEREGRIQSQLVHPNLVRVTEVIEHHGEPGLVMELVFGTPMDEWLSKYQPTPDETRGIFEGILRGVACAHREGVVHRDLKPGNIILSEQLGGVVPKVMDFGLVKDRGSAVKLTQTGMLMGSPRYMAPEQIRDAHDVDQRCDVFALGCILYEMAAGRPAFDADHALEVLQGILSGDVPPIPEHVEDDISGAIVRMLAHEPEDRVASCEEALEALGIPTFGDAKPVQLRKAGRKTLIQVPDDPDITADRPNELGGDDTDELEVQGTMEVPRTAVAESRGISGMAIAVAGVLGLGLLIAVAGGVGIGLSMMGGSEAGSDESLSGVMPVPAPTTALAPAPEPEPVVEATEAKTKRKAKAKKRGGLVKVAGDAVLVELEDAGGNRIAPTAAGPGRYKIWATFPGQAMPVAAGKLTVADAPQTITCKAMALQCRVK